MFKNKLFLTIGGSSMAVVILSSSFYYSFFFHPKTVVSSFISQTEEDFTKAKENRAKLDSLVSNWNDIAKGDIDKKEEDLGKIKGDFSSFEEKLGKLTPSSQLQETYNTLERFTEKGAEVSKNLSIIASYFKKTAESVKAFNNLNTTSKSLDEVTKLTMDFKSVSQNSLAELEKAESPKLLINLDKDYKDLLRQYVSSADALLDAINKKDVKKIESVGKESDEAVLAIDKQIEEDLKAFKENSRFSEELLVMKELEKTIDENFGSLKAKYKI